MRAAASRLLIVWALLITVVVQAQEGADLTAEPGEEPQQQVLTIWWPDVLAPPDNEAATVLLQEQIDAFVAAESNVEVNLRLKRVGTVGGIMSTMRTASSVAPDALPNLTLIRRQDLVTAQQNGLLESMEEHIASALQNDLRNVIALGQVENELYGLPYMLDLQHIIYRPQNDRSYESWAFSDVLAREEPFVFPAGRNAGLNHVLLLQYLSVGGRFSNEGTLQLEEEALLALLDFYQQANDAGIIDGFALNYNSPQDYLDAFISNQINVGVFSSATYLELSEDNRNLEIAPIPTADGQAASILGGWVWVLVRTSLEEQTLAIRFLNWMLDTNRQFGYANAIDMIPSLSSAFALSVEANPQLEPYNALLDNAVLPFTENNGGTLARALQDALSSVLTTELSAEQAAQRLIDQQNE